MVRKVFLTILLLAFIAIAFISIFKYRELNNCYLSLKTHHEQILLEKKKAENDLTQLSKVKDALEERFIDLQDNLTFAEIELSKALSKVEELNKDVLSLEVEKETIKDTLQRRIIHLRRQKNILGVRFNSITELKRALEEAQRRQKLAKKEYKENLDKLNLILGNKGYLVQNGKSTLCRKFQRKINVEIIMP